MRNWRWQFHPWYLAHFFNLGDENELPRIFRQPSGDAVQYKTADKKRFIKQYTDEHTCPKLTNANMYEICCDTKWLENYHINPILDCIQFDLRAMGRRCSIVGPTLRESELMTTGRVAVEQDYRNALSMTSHGRNARWYESDDIFSCGKMGLDAIGSRIISSTSAAHGPHAGTTLCRYSEATSSIARSTSTR